MNRRSKFESVDIKVPQTCGIEKANTASLLMPIRKVGKK